MRLRRPVSLILLFAAAAYAGGANAQVSRTWVSGVGDDANPCSRTAPCKTFPGAISKTNPGGEISVLDPGGFGAVTITKAITIDGGGGPVASILVSGTNGIIVQAGANDVVTIRNITIEGLKSGIDGIRFTAGSALHVEHVNIRNFTGAAINFIPNQAGNAKLFVSDSIIQNSGGGIMVAPTTGPAVASVESTSVNGNNTYGMRVQGNASAIAKNVTANGNLNGFYVTDIANANPALTLDGCTTAHNSNDGIRVGFGGAGMATANVSNTNVFENGTGVHTDAHGQAFTFGNNHVVGNTAPGAFTGPVPPS
jgi:hypothetical protein